MAVARQQPATDDASEHRRRLERRLKALDQQRSSWLAQWRELARLIQPRLGRWVATANDTGRGQPKHQAIIDATATLAAQRFGAGLMAGVSSPARPWFQLTVPDVEAADASAVKGWLAEVERRMERVLQESNFYRAIATAYQEIGVFGTAALLILEDYDDVIRCYPLTAGEYYLALDHRLEVSALYREVALTVEQVAGRWGLEACSDPVASAIRAGRLDDEIVVAQAIEPAARASGIANHAWQETWWESGGSADRVLSIRGYHERPFVAPRWEVVGNDPYGASPGMTALGDVKALQFLHKRKAQALDKVVNPPLLADARLEGKPATVLPGGVTYLPQGAGDIGMKPIYQVKPDLPALLEEIAATQRQIKAIYYEDLFLAISQLDDVRTATEIVARKEEKMLMLGPALDQLHDELLGPAIERVFAIMARARLLPPPPPALAGRFVGVEFVSMLAQAQRATATTAVERMVAFVGNLAGAVPAVLDKLDTDTLIDEYGEALGVSPKILRSNEDVAAIRQGRAQQAQQQQQIQQSMAAVQAAQTLSQTDVGGGQSALQKMLGGSPV